MPVFAAVAALVVWAVAVTTTEGPQILAAGEPQDVGPVAVALTALLAALAGWGTLALFERRLRHARRHWTTLSVVVMLASLAGPISSGVDATGTTTLVLLHLVVGTVIIIGLRRDAARGQG